MSGPSYRLQTPRPRHPPTPLNFDISYRPSSTVHVHQDSQTLLYDLPSATISPPTSPRSINNLISPSSPSFRSRSRGLINGRPTPPPGSRNRSTTPSGVASTELELFAEHCRSWYYDQDDNSGRLMTQTLATLPPSQRAPFSRLQASIRSAYHRSVNARRHAEFQAHLNATIPGGSLMPHARANPRGKLAQKERHERTERFLRNWCNMGMPGTKPFFEALWAIMRLQAISENLGGAGCCRIEWELDDAVFKESAGKDFMLEAIDFLKGVLAFEETTPLRTPTSSNCDRIDLDLAIPMTLHSRAQSQPLPSDQAAPEAAPIVQPKRARAPSDPFLDAPHSRSMGLFSHSPNPKSILPSTLEADEPPPSSRRPLEVYLALLQQDDSFDDEPYLRVWTAPDLDNPEILQLLKLFPSFVTRRPLPRFPVQPPRQGDIEEGEEENLEARQIHFGTGSLWVGSKQRTGAWEGGWFTRFLLWWKKLFC